MGLKKLGLNEGERFQRLVGRWRCVEALMSARRGEIGVRELRFESGAAPWDDIIEVVASAGRIEHHAWQVRSGTESVSWGDLVELLSALRQRPDLTSARLAIPGPLPIGRGTQFKTNQIARIRARSASSQSEMLKVDTKLLVKISNALQLTRDEAVALIQRFEIVEVGTSVQLANLIEARLQGWTDLATAAAVGDRLGALVDEGHEGRSLTMETLRGAIAAFGDKIRPTDEDVAHHRREYLNAVINAASDRLVLGGLGSATIRLADVRVDVEATVEGLGLPGSALSTTLAALASSRDVLVVAIVGGGKTELLHELAAVLARRALDAPSDPLPVLVSAREFLSGSMDLRFASFAGVAGSLAALGRARCTALLLVDGLDELDVPSDPFRSERSFGQFRVAGIVGATRPARLPPVRNAVVVRLEPWAPACAGEFLEKWRATLTSGADGSFAAAPSTGALGSNPLTATLSLAAPGLGTETSRAAAFRAVARELLQRWASQRGHGTWEKVATEVRRLARAVLSEKRSLITATELYAYLERIAPDREVRVHEATEFELGVLVRRGDGYEFALRGIAEFLAGEDYASEPDEELLAIAPRAGMHEVARHAIGLVALSDARRAERLLLALVSRGDQDDPGLCNPGLRELLLALHVGGDVGERGAGAASAIAVAAMRRIRDEESNWVGERVADVLSDAIEREGPLREHIVPSLQNVLRAPGDPVSWYRAQSWTDPSDWIRCLRHREAAVRVLAVERLAGSMGEAPDVEAHLVAELGDISHTMAFQRAPALAAALALRDVRTPAVQARVPGYTAAVSEEHSQDAMVAAVLLRPPEVDARAVVRVYRQQYSIYLPPQEPLEELASTEEGARVLDEEWPTWKREVSARDLRERLARPHADSTEPPPSVVVRVRAARVLPAELDVTAEESWAAMTDIWPGLAARALGRMALVAPTLAAARMTPEMLTRPAGIDVENVLRRAAQRHPEFGSAIVHAYWSLPRSMERRRFLGRCLEPSVIRRDRRAIDAYTEWLPTSMQVSTPFVVPPLDESALLADPSVHGVAHQCALETLNYSIDGRADESGRVSRLAPTTMGSILRTLSAVWRAEPVFRRRLFESGTAEPNAARLGGLLMAVSGIVLTRTEQIALAESVHEVFRTSDRSDVTFWALQAADLLKRAGRLNLAPDLSDLLMSIVETSSSLNLAAAAILVPALADAKQGAVLSAHVAPNATETMLRSIDAANLRSLVELAPRAWFDWSMARISAIPESGSDLLGVLEALPLELRIKAGRWWQECTAGHEIPWVSGALETEPHRPADLNRGFLFDLGLDIGF